MIKAAGTPSVVWSATRSQEARRLGSTRGSHPGLWGVHLPMSLSICWNLNMWFSGRKIFIRMLKGSDMTSVLDHLGWKRVCQRCVDRTIHLQFQNNQRHLKATRSIGTVGSADKLRSRSQFFHFPLAMSVAVVVNVFLAVVCVLQRSIMLLYRKRKATYKWGIQKDCHLTPEFQSGIQKVWNL